MKTTISTSSRRHSRLFRRIVLSLGIVLAVLGAGYGWLRHLDQELSREAETAAEVVASDFSEGTWKTRSRSVPTRSQRPAERRFSPWSAPDLQVSVPHDVELGASAPDAVPVEAYEDERPQDPREPPIFDLLRKSKGQPIPPEVAALAEEVTKNATNGVQRARAIYDWLTANIRYDAQEWDHITGGASSYTHAHDPASVLKRGTTVCIGYSWLFDAMCESVGVKSSYLIGDVRGYRGTPDEDLVSAFKHAWNVVQFDDGSWHLLDATWGASQEGEPPGAAKSRADYYFDTPANQFVYDHLPENDAWQLLDDPVPTKAAFSTLPNLKPAFFQNGLELTEGYTSTLRANPDQPAALTFSAPAGVSVAATFGPYHPGSTLVQIPAFVRDGVATIIVPKHESGVHLLRLYSKSPSGHSFDCSADFVIKGE